MFSQRARFTADLACETFENFLDNESGDDEEVWLDLVVFGGNNAQILRTEEIILAPTHRIIKENGDSQLTKLVKYWRIFWTTKMVIMKKF